MASNKEKELKDFLISERKKTAPGITSAPVWVLQKANKRIWNKKQKRNWKQSGFGKQFRQRKGEKK